MSKKTPSDLRESNIHLCPSEKEPVPLEERRSCDRRAFEQCCQTAWHEAVPVLTKKSQRETDLANNSILFNQTGCGSTIKETLLTPLTYSVGNKSWKMHQFPLLITTPKIAATSLPITCTIFQENTAIQADQHFLTQYFFSWRKNKSMC